MIGYVFCPSEPTGAPGCETFSSPENCARMSHDPREKFEKLVEVREKFVEVQRSSMGCELFELLTNFCELLTNFSRNRRSPTEGETSRSGVALCQKRKFKPCRPSERNYACRRYAYRRSIKTWAGRPTKPSPSIGKGSSSHADPQLCTGNRRNA